MMTHIRSSTCSSPALIRAERGSPDIYVRSPDSLRPKDRDGAKRLARRPPEHPFSPMARFARWRPPCVEGGQTSDRAEGPLWAVKPNSRSLSNVSYGADSGPSRGDHSRRPFRPTEASMAAVCYDRFAQIAASPVLAGNGSSRPLAGLKIGSVNGRGARESGLWLKASIAP